MVKRFIIPTTDEATQDRLARYNIQVNQIFYWRHDTQHNDIQHNDIQHKNDTQHNAIQHNDAQHNNDLPLC